MSIKKYVILALIVLSITGCSNDNAWNSMVNKEFSNMDNWAGSGFYFYEKEHERYCTYMVYGSGLPVAGYFTTKIENDEGKMVIQLPIEKAKLFLEEESDNTQENIDLELEYIDEKIVVNEIEFTYSEGLESHKYIDIENE